MTPLKHPVTSNTSEPKGTHTTHVQSFQAVLVQSRWEVELIHGQLITETFPAPTQRVTSEVLLIKPQSQQKC